MTTIERQDNGMTGGASNAAAPIWKLIRIIGWTLAALILLMPLIAMQFSNEVNWSLGDFLFAAIIVGGTGLAFEVAIRRGHNNAYRAGVVVALAAAFLITWINAAVGFIGSGANPANVMYFMLLPVVITGCFASGFQAHGMATTMIAAAIVQTLITVYAFVSGLVTEEPAVTILAINGFFILSWLGAGILLRRAAITRA